MKKAAKRQLLFWLVTGLVFVGLISLLNDILLPFIVAIGIAYFLDPLVDRLEKLGLSRTLAIAVLVVVSGLVLALGMIVLMPLLVNQLKALVASLPDQIQTIKGFVEDTGRVWFGDDFNELQTGMDAAIMELTQSWRSSAGQIIAKVLSGGMAFLNLLSLMLITPVVAFYMLADWEKSMALIDSWLPRDYASTIRRLAHEINDVIAGFIRGQGTVCLLLAIFYSLGLMAVGLDYSLLIGIVSGVAAFVPYVGAALSFLLAGGVAVHQFTTDWWLIAQVFGVMLAGQLIEGTILSPRIVGGHVRLHPVWLIFSLFAFGYLFGFVGLLVAVPLAASLGVVARFGLQEYLESEFYAGNGRTDNPDAGALSADGKPAIAPGAAPEIASTTKPVEKAGTAASPSAGSQTDTKTTSATAKKRKRK